MAVFLTRIAEKFQPTLKVSEKCGFKLWKTAEFIGFLLTKLILKLLRVLWKMHSTATWITCYKIHLS